MEVFAKECYIQPAENVEFFEEWYSAIIKDFNKFKIILEDYRNTDEKKCLIDELSRITSNLFDSLNQEDRMIMVSTYNYFLFSFYEQTDDVPRFVLLSKDYKNILFASEEMECFDDPDFDEELRYGINLYSSYSLRDNEVKRVLNCKKEYTIDYNSNFDCPCLFANFSELEEHLSFLLKCNNGEKDPVKVFKIKK